MSSSPAHALHPTERETPAICRPVPRSRPVVTLASTAVPFSVSVLAARWFRLNKGAYCAATLIGALSLVAFLIVWHLLTKYRVVFFVRFTNVPSPLAVYDSFTKAIHEPKFLMHVLLSCRRIIFGFSLAALVAVPLGLVMGRFKLIHEIVFPVSEVLRPIPAIAWVPMAIMLWPTNEQSIVFITFLGSFFPILVNTLHGMVPGRSGSGRGPRNASAPGKPRSFAKSIFRHRFLTFSPGLPSGWALRGFR